MLDFHHNSEIFSEAFDTIPIPDAIVPHVESRPYWDNQTVEVQFQTVHEAELDWGKYRLRWELNIASGVEGIGVNKQSAAVAPIVSARVPMPRVQTAQLMPLSLHLIDKTGFELANHSNDLLLVPSQAAQARYEGQVAVVTLAGTEAGIIRQLNYIVEDSLSNRTQVIVTDSPNAETLDWVRTGGKMLLVCEGDNPAFWEYHRGVISESHWITSTSWLRPEVYSNLKVENPLKLPFQHVMPRGNIGGLPLEDTTVQHDFLAGRTSGWVQRPNIHTVQFCYGRGTVIMTTYTLLESLRFGEPDPVGVVMLNDLIEYLVSDLCKPSLHVNA